ncbi:hypothetical protein STANM309S_02199 [Streptomyces tanashiensis]
MLGVYLPLIVVAALCAALFMDNLAPVKNDTGAAKEAVRASTPTSQSASGWVGSSQLLCRELPGRSRILPVAGHRVEVRGHAVLVDGALRPVPPAGMALLGLLARRPGWVVSRADLLKALPGAGSDEHAVETAMARLRTALGTPKLIQTVVKRGYRLALDPPSEEKYDG